MDEKKTIEVGHVAARFLSLSLPMGLTLDEVIVQGEGLELGKDPFSVKLKEPGSLEVRVSEASIAMFLNRKAPGGLKDFKIKLADGLIRIQATATVIISLNVGAICKLRVEDEKLLFVDLDRVEAVGGTGAFNLVKKQLDAINPVLDAKELPVEATLTGVVIENSWLVIKGTISPKSQ